MAIGTRVSSMQLCRYLDGAQELSQSVMEKNNYAALLTLKAYIAKKAALDCDFFIKNFTGLAGLVSDFADIVGYTSQDYDEAEEE